MLCKLATGSGELDSLFEYWISGRRQFSVCQLSTGGGKARPNKQYLPAQELLLKRFVKSRMKINKIAVVKGGKKTQPYDDVSEIDLSRLPSLHDVKAFRIEVNKLTKDVGMDSPRPGGSRTRKVLFEIEWPGEGKLLDADVREALDFRPTAASQDETKYSPLGIYLAAQHVDKVVLPLSKLNEIVGKLPKSASSPQFWANVHGHHWSRRKQWLGNGFEAFWEPRKKSVCFVRSSRPTVDTVLLEARVRIEREKRRRKGRERQKPPAGSTEPQRVRSVLYRFERSPAIVAWVLENAAGRCEGCSGKGPFVNEKKERYLEVHHLRPLAEGGPDTVDNAVALCPNCHRELHLGLDRALKRNQILRKIDRLIDHPYRDPDNPGGLSPT